MLAGDHKQLAPTVKSRKAAEGGRLDPKASDKPSDSADGVGDGLGLTMFDRVLRDVGSGVCRMLDVQYRMNRDICDWASNEVRYSKDDFDFLFLLCLFRVLRVICFVF